MQEEDQEDRGGRTGDALLPEVSEVAVSTQQSALSFFLKSRTPKAEGSIWLRRAEGQADHLFRKIMGDDMDPSPRLGSRGFGIAEKAECRVLNADGYTFGVNI